MKTIWVVYYEFKGEGFGITKGTFVETTRQAARNTIAEMKEDDKALGWTGEYKIKKYVEAT